MLQFSNLAKIKELIKRRNELVNGFLSIPKSEEFEKDGDMISIAKHIKNRIGNRPGVVPSVFSRALEKDMSDGQNFKEYNQIMNELINVQIKSCLKQLYSNLEKALKHILDMTIDGSTEQATKGLVSCRAFLKVYYAIHNAICFAKSKEIEAPNKIKKGTYEFSIAKLMDKPYGSNVEEGTVYGTFYSMLGIIIKIIKEKDETKREALLAKQVMETEGGFLQTTKDTFSIGT